jgi:adenylosuccinate synthase
MVVDPWVLEEELDRWHSLTKERPEGKRLFISERASVILPFHRMYDSADKVVGTTGRGIGPAYRDRIERVGIRFVDIPFVIDDSDKIDETVSRMNMQLDSVGVNEKIGRKDFIADLKWIMDRFGDAIRPTGAMIDKALKNGENVLLEGAQGAMLDIDQGTYPFVTSSVTSRANATHGAGIHPGHVENCFGISKAYTTRVGNGPFPTELPYDTGPGNHMAMVGHEFGTTTGRPRRTGWLDMVSLRDSHRINGYTGIVLTKLDVLGGLDELNICTGYDLDGQIIDYMPTSSHDLARCKPIYERHQGFPALKEQEWIDMAELSRSDSKGFEVLPETALSYVRRIEELSGIPIVSIGIGPDRRASIASLGGPFDVDPEVTTF